MKNYEELKAENDMKIVDWFTPEVRYPMHLAYNFRESFQVVKETEKAVCVSVDYDIHGGDYEGTTNIWVPKKCIESRKDYFTAEHEREERRQSNMNAGLERFMKLRQFCIDHNVISDGKRRYSTATLMRKLGEKGLTYSE